MLPRMTDEEAKKRALIEADGAEREGALIPLVRELAEGDGFHPLTAAMKDHWLHKGTWLARLVPYTGIALVGTFGLVATLARHQLDEYLGMIFFFAFLPLWGVISVGTSLDQFLRETPLNPVEQLKRWGPRVRELLPAFLLHLIAAWASFRFWYAARFDIGQVSFFLFLATLWVLSLSWGLTVVRRVVAGRTPRQATLEGPVEAGVSVLRMPGHLLQMALSPTQGFQRRGKASIAANTLLIWAGVFIAFVAGIVGVRELLWGWIGGPWWRRELTMMLLASVPTFLAYEAGISLSVYNYLGAMAEDAEPEALEADRRETPQLG